MDIITVVWDHARRCLNWLMNGSACDRPPGVHPTTKVYNLQNIDYDPKTGNIFKAGGCVYSAVAKIKIGPHTWIGQNVGIITQNHNPANPDEMRSASPITIGSYCWLGMNVVILPGVTLGDYTTVGAGSIVTHSFPEGHQVIAGNPANTINNNCNKEN